MSAPHEHSGVPGTRPAIRSPQNLAGGIFLLLLAALALWLTRDLPQGSLRIMGPSMLPDWLAFGIGLCGAALVFSAFVGKGGALEGWSAHGPLLVAAGILGFSITIRPFTFGALEMPGLGLVVAGPLAIIIGGMASPEARLRDLLIMSLSLTPFCMVLFGDLLNLPIPIFPQSLASLFPADWTQKDVLRATAAIMTALAIVVFFAGGRRNQAEQARAADRNERV